MFIDTVFMAMATIDTIINGNGNRNQICVFMVIAIATIDIIINGNGNQICVSWHAE